MKAEHLSPTRPRARNALSGDRLLCSRRTWGHWFLFAGLSFAWAAQLSAQDLQIRFFDVGQGDAALITSPEGKNALIDAGPDPERVLGYLGALNVDSLDLVVASHNHADHIRGLPGVLTSIATRFYMDNGIPATTVIYRDVLTAVQGSGAQYLEASARIIRLGSVSLRVLPKPPGVETQNNGSVGILLTYGSFKALLTGDAEVAERSYWLQHDSIPTVSVLKVAHHGSWNGTDSAWVAATGPHIAIISVGADNQYGHPSSGTVELLHAVGAEVYRTDQVGTIEVTVRPDGRMRINTTGSQTVTVPTGRVLTLPHPR